MTVNESGIDRVIRGVVALGAAGGAFAVGITSGLGIALAVVAVIAGVTAAIGFCPLYRIFGISTCAVPSKD
jgi:hypothetical protein